MPDVLARLKSALTDRYAVESEIGRGGMAVVFLADDLKHHRKVAIKVLHPELGAAIGGARFAHEIEIVGGLTHPHVLPLYDSGETDGLLFYVMPYVEGESLRQRLEREQQLPVDEAIGIAQEVADALDHAHQQGIVHRDIKPANILLEGGHAVVTDFGVARAVSKAGGEKVTATGMAVGTPAYMSPEQAAGKEVDERSDLYALGCILYEMLAGEPPLTGASPQSTAAKRLTDRPTSLVAIRSTVPGNLQSLVERTLATSPVDRPTTARALAEELEEVRRSPEPAIRMPARRRWLLPAIGAVAVAAVVVVSNLNTDRSAMRDVRLLPVGADLGDQSIAVLPVANNTGADSLDWLRSGLADALQIHLAQMEAVRVVSVGRLLDLMRQAGHEESDPIPEDLALNVAAASGARAMVKLSLVKLGDGFRLDAQLTDLGDGTIITAAQAHGSDFFALVDDVSAHLLEQVLGETVTPTELTPVALLTTGSLDAYREYQLGRQAASRFLIEDAKERWQRAVELDSTFALAWLSLGRRAQIEQDDDLAATYLKRAEQFYSGASTRDRLRIQAGLARAGGQYDESIDYLETLVASNPYDKGDRFVLGVSYRWVGRLDDSRSTLEEVLALDPYYSPAINDLAYQAAFGGDEARADSLSLLYIEMEPDLWNSYDTRSEILMMFGRHAEVREPAVQAIRLNPDAAAAYGRLTLSYLNEGDRAGARQALRSLRDNPDGEVYARWFETDTYVVEGRYRDAFASNRSAFEKAREYGFNGFLPLILAEAGVHANAVGEYEQAEGLFNELVRLDRQRTLALFGLLGTYGKQRRFEDMSRVRDAAAAAIDSVPDFADRRRAASLVHFADGLVSWYHGDAEGAVLFFEEARSAGGMPTSEPLRGLQGEDVLSLIQVGQAAAALEIADGLVGLADEGWYTVLRHQGWYLRGRAYEALGETEQALASYQQLLDVAGDRVREVVLFQDTPERVARLRGEP